MKITVGADPEFFLELNGEIVPCVGLLPGSKKHPALVPEARNGLTVQEDNVTVELGWEPCSRQEFVGRTQNAWRDIHNFLRVMLGPSARLHSISSALFRADQLASAQARTFGCDPDNDAYAGGNERNPQNAPAPDLRRHAGGHLHIGYDKTATPVPDHAIVQFMDLAYLADVRSGDDLQEHRRVWYGKAGSYRKKSYGLEYRTPSNYWMRATYGAEYILRTAEDVINKPSLARSLYKKIDWGMVQKAINENNPRLFSSSLAEHTISTLYDGENELGDGDSLAEAA